MSHAFSMGDWEPERHERVDGRNVYFWVVPARVEGRWRLDAGGNAGISLDLKQKYQKVSGSAQIDGRSVPLEDARLQGAEISFKLDGKTYHGKVDGSSMSAIDGNGDAWRAVRN